MIPPRIQVIIDLAAIHHNFIISKKLAPHSKTIAMVKGNAYGHDLVKVAKALSDAEAFGVADLNEAIQLRQANIHKKIVLMAGFFTYDDIAAISRYQLDCVVHTEQQLVTLEQADLPTPITVWLKIDTGMHRLGFMPEQVASVYNKLKQNKNVGQIHFMSHLAEADKVRKPTTQKQLACFQEVTNGYPGERTLANSAGIIAWPETHFDWVRPGIMLYGISPLENKIGTDHQLKPVMLLQSQLIAMHDCQPGDSIGYGGTWQCREATKIGVAAIGYADGYPRHLTNGTPVLIGDRICPLVGRVSMDFITVDLTAYPEAKIGDIVTLWGGGLAVEHIAVRANTIGYELTTRIAPRLNQMQFITTDESAQYDSSL